MSKKSNKLDMKEFEEKVKNFLAFLEIPYKNISHYVLAFVHRSVLNEQIINIQESNERLEFLGDAVLELIVTELLFAAYPEKNEGELTDIRSALVRGKNLATIAENLCLDEMILLSKGEVLAGGNKNPYILANTFEAFLGGLYLDHGYPLAKVFVEKYVVSSLSEILEKHLYVDPKSYLQEYTQAKYNITPTYDVVGESGQDHDKNYRIGVFLGTTQIWEGGGSSKKKAQQEAAENALAEMPKWENILLKK